MCQHPSLLIDHLNEVSALRPAAGVTEPAVRQRASGRPPFASLERNLRTEVDGDLAAGQGRMFMFGFSVRRQGRGF